MAEKKADLFLLQYLKENTDMDHPVPSTTLKAVLRENGYAADPRTIRRNVERLIASGYEIIAEEYSGRPTLYHYNDHEWDKSELQILIDAVSSAQFITPKKTESMVRKLAAMSGPNEADLLPGVYVSEHIKARNDQILYILQQISEGIRLKKKISFMYYIWDASKNLVPKNHGQPYHVSPYATVWNADRYYLVAWSDKHADVVTFRIDRMGLPAALTEDAVPPPEDFDLQAYSGRVTRMYEGADTQITLRCKSFLMNQIIDKFGPDVEVFNTASDTFDVSVTASVSGTFFSWLFQFAGQIVLLDPPEACALYRKMLETVLSDQTDHAFHATGELRWKL